MGALLWIVLCAIGHGFLVAGNQLGSMASMELVCDPSTWRTGRNVPGFVEPLMASWCDAAAQDAAKQARAVQNDLASCAAERGECRNALEICKNERMGLQQECEEEKMALEVKIASTQEKSLAEAAYWKQMCDGRISVAQCNYEKQVATAKLQDDRKLLATQPFELRAQNSQLDSLEEALASCRLDKAFANATTIELVRKLKDQIQLLYGILSVSGTIFIVLIPFLLLQVNRSAEPHRLPDMNKKNVQVYSGAQTFNLLKSMCEEGHGCVRTILTSVQGDEEKFFLLVPVNCFRTRRFALFGAGGDFSGDAEAANDIVPGQSLSIVLYDYTGHAFSETTLDKLEMSPQAIAERVIPKDSDFPTRLDVGVLWVASKGAFLTNADGMSMLNDNLRRQAWIQYLCR